MGKYRKKPVIIDAVRLPEKGNYDLDEFQQFVVDHRFINFESGRNEELIIHTLEGDMTAQPGDWIIRGVKGEFYPCKPDIFEATYEKV